MRLNRWLLGAILCTSPGFARAMDLRLGFLGGIGNSTVSARGASQKEGPGGFGAFVDYAVSARQTIGLEHIRTFALKPVSTGVSISGLTTRWYFLNPAPTGVTGMTDNTTYLDEKYLAPYLGAGVGFSQSSLVPDTEGGTITNAVGIYGKGRVGMDIPWLARAGFNTDASIATTFLGFGTVTMFNVTMGLYYYF